MIYAKACVGVLVALLVLDAVWLGFVARDFYASRLGELLREKPNLVAAGSFYIVYVAGVVFFAVRPALATPSLAQAAMYGGLLGALVFATYDLTNLAILNAWSVEVVLIDILWGTALTAVAAGSGYLLARTGS